MIYLASPFSHLNPDLERLRYQQTLAFSAKALREGVLLFSPIVYGWAFMREQGFGGDAETWLPFNHDMLLRSRELWVLPLAGWEDSKGVAAEIEYAINNHKQVTYLFDEV